MGKKVVVFCDRCSADVTDKTHMVVTIQSHHPHEIILCSSRRGSCYDKFKEWLHEPQSS